MTRAGKDRTSLTRIVTHGNDIIESLPGKLLNALTPGVCNVKASFCHHLHRQRMPAAELARGLLAVCGKWTRCVVAQYLFEDRPRFVRNKERDCRALVL